MWSTWATIYEDKGDIDACHDCDNHVFDMLKHHKTNGTRMCARAEVHTVDARRRMALALMELKEYQSAERFLLVVRTILEDFCKANVRLQKRALALKCIKALRVLERIWREAGQTDKADELKTSLDETLKYYEDLTRKVLQDTREKVKRQRAAPQDGVPAPDIKSETETTAGGGEVEESGAQNSNKKTLTKKQKKRQAKEKRRNIQRGKHREPLAGLDANDDHDATAINSALQAEVMELVDEVAETVHSEADDTGTTTSSTKEPAEHVSGPNAQADEVQAKEVCAVCLESVTDCSGTSPVLSCQHVFHRNCIQAWMLRYESVGHPFSCPSCRQPIFEPTAALVVYSYIPSRRELIVREASHLYALI